MGGDVDGVIGRLAAGQHGVVSREQALAAGLSPDQIARRLGSGRWVRVAPGAYRLSGAPPTWRAEVMAAVLSCGPIAAASHATAAHLHGLLTRRPATIEVVLPRGGVRVRDFVVHESTDLAPEHIGVVDGVPTTTVARTIVDIGVPHGIGVVARCTDGGRRSGQVGLSEVATLHASVARRGRNGVGPARRVLKERLAWDQVTESHLEDRFLRLLQRHDLRRPVGQHQVHDRDGRFLARLDFAYPAEMVAIELDGVAFHSDPGSFRRDRERQNRLVLLGWKVLRFTYWDLIVDEHWVVSAVRNALHP